MDQNDTTLDEFKEIHEEDNKEESKGQIEQNQKGNTQDMNPNQRVKKYKLDYKELQNRQNFDLTDANDMEIVKTILRKQSTARTKADIDIIYKAFRDVKFIKDMEKDVSQLLLRKLLKNVSFAPFQKRQIVFNQGDIGQNFYIIIQGSAWVLVPNKFSSNVTDEQLKMSKDIMANTELYFKMQDDQYLVKALPQFNLIATLKSGYSFGEIALRQQTVRTATVMCAEESVCASVSREIFNSCVSEFYKMQRDKEIKFLHQFQIFTDMYKQDVEMILMSCIKHHFNKNYVIYTEKQPSDRIFFLQEGEIQISKQSDIFTDNPNDLYVNRTKDLNMNSVPYRNLGNTLSYKKTMKRVPVVKVCPDSIFGEEEAFNNKARETQAVVVSNDAIYYSLKLKDFYQIMQKKYTAEFIEQIKKDILVEKIKYRQEKLSKNIIISQMYNNFEQKIREETFYSTNKLLHTTEIIRSKNKTQKNENAASINNTLQPSYSNSPAAANKNINQRDTTPLFITDAKIEQLKSTIAVKNINNDSQHHLLSSSLVYNKMSDNDNNLNNNENNIKNNQYNNKKKNIDTLKTNHVNLIKNKIKNQVNLMQNEENSNQQTTKQENLIQKTNQEIGDRKQQSQIEIVPQLDLNKYLTSPDNRTSQQTSFHKIFNQIRETNNKEKLAQTIPELQFVSTPLSGRRLQSAQCKRNAVKDTERAATQQPQLLLQDMNKYREINQQLSNRPISTLQKYPNQKVEDQIKKSNSLSEQQKNLILLSMHKQRKLNTSENNFYSFLENHNNQTNQHNHTYLSQRTSPRKRNETPEHIPCTKQTQLKQTILKDQEREVSKSQRNQNQPHINSQIDQKQNRNRIASKTISCNNSQNISPAKKDELNKSATKDRILYSSLCEDKQNGDQVNRQPKYSKERKSQQNASHSSLQKQRKQAVLIMQPLSENDNLQRISCNDLEFDIRMKEMESDILNDNYVCDQVEAKLIMSLAVQDIIQKDMKIIPIDNKNPLIDMEYIRKFDRENKLYSRKSMMQIRQTSKTPSQKHNKNDSKQKEQQSQIEDKGSQRFPQNYMHLIIDQQREKCQSALASGESTPKRQTLQSNPLRVSLARSRRLSVNPGRFYLKGNRQQQFYDDMKEDFLEKEINQNLNQATNEKTQETHISDEYQGVKPRYKNMKLTFNLSIASNEHRTEQFKRQVRSQLGKK